MILRFTLGNTDRAALTKLLCQFAIELVKSSKQQVLLLQTPREDKVTSPEAFLGESSQQKALRHELGTYLRYPYDDLIHSDKLDLERLNQNVVESSKRGIYYLPGNVHNLGLYAASTWQELAEETIKVAEERFPIILVDAGNDELLRDVFGRDEITQIQVYDCKHRITQRLLDLPQDVLLLFQNHLEESLLNAENLYRYEGISMERVLPLLAEEHELYRKNMAAILNRLLFSVEGGQTNDRSAK